METVQAKLTVWFDEPFWVGVYERIVDGRLEAAKVFFGSEPKDYEVYEYFLKNWSRLRFSPPVDLSADTEKRTSPKRMQRAIRNQLLQAGVGTKAQQALKLQQEQQKTERKICHRQRSEEEKEKQFELRQQQKKEKHRGR